ncbi:haloacid dehalogenase-like hydrolase [Acetobacteraceae bacterium B3987]|nr:haloacid dehalogenase-like hydrolase [Acetobacteraceae bacterium B3987]
MIRAALVYDFDGTLAKGNLQETSFIPNIKMSTEEFWDEVKKTAKDSDADEILTYMYVMLRKAEEAGVSVTKNDLKEHGKKAPLFEGLESKDWFNRINCFARCYDIELEHYVVSSGIQEMIEGCSIFSCFKKVFASKFIYKGDVAVWPGVGINYTTKTQYLFRINKGIDNNWDNKAINSFMPDEDRPIPFNRMVFLGDGDTDIPAMKMLTYQGGHSVAVYDPDRSERGINKIHRLISDGRVDFVAPADFQEKSQLDIIVKGIIGRMANKLKLKL